ncbi:MAG: hypothetical protein QOG25_2881, partial [Acetobacteraceae bacterium]|nr:hypothetical protein [Acetobacteraceae bacterium]
LPDNPDDASLVKAILAMATGLDLKVVAEGVEKEEQLHFLVTHGCDFAQGYLLARPMDEKAYASYLESGQADEPVCLTLPPTGETTAEEAAAVSFKTF